MYVSWDTTFPFFHKGEEECAGGTYRIYKCIYSFLNNVQCTNE